VDFVSFTGSVNGGKFVGEAASHAAGFKGVCARGESCLGVLETVLPKSILDSSVEKIPQYVRADADLDYTAAELVDGMCKGSQLQVLSSEYWQAPFQLWPKLLRVEVVFPRVISER